MSQIRRPSTLLGWLFLVLCLGGIGGMLWSICVVFVSSYDPDPTTGRIYLIPARGGLRHYTTLLNAVIVYTSFAVLVLSAFLGSFIRSRGRPW